MDTFGHLMVTAWVLAWVVIGIAGIVKLAGILGACHG